MYSLSHPNQYHLAAAILEVFIPNAAWKVVIPVSEFSQLLRRFSTMIGITPLIFGVLS
jgi:hypothetical protein